MTALGNRHIFARGDVVGECAPAGSVPCGAERLGANLNGVQVRTAQTGARLAFPWIALQRWWQGWSTAPPPRQLQALIDSVAAGCGLHLYIPN